LWCCLLFLGAELSTSLATTDDDVESWLSSEEAEDLTGNDVVDVIDYFQYYIEEWPESAYGIDVNSDGQVDFDDLYLWSETEGLLSEHVGLVAGDGNYGGDISFGDEGPATRARLGFSGDLAVDGQGRVYKMDDLSQGDFRGTLVRRIDLDTGLIRTVAGSREGWDAPRAYGGPAVESWIGGRGIGVDIEGNLYITGGGLARVDNTTGIITELKPRVDWHPTDVAVGRDGLLYVAEVFPGDLVYKINESNGLFTPVPTRGINTYMEDDRIVSEGPLHLMNSIYVDAAGVIFVTEPDHNRIRQIDANGTVSTVTYANRPQFLTGDSAGNLYATTADGDVIRIDPGGQVARFAIRTLHAPGGIAYDEASGLLFVSADHNGWGSRIYSLNPKAMQFEEYTPLGPWQSVISAAQITGVAIDPHSVSGLYASAGVGLFERRDDGWERILSLAQSDFLETSSSGIGTLYADPSNAGTLYLGGRQKLLITRDSAETWETVTLDFTIVDMARSTWQEESALFVLGIPSHYSQGLYRSNDDGRTWQQVSFFPLQEVEFWLSRRGSMALSVDPQNPGRLYVGTERGLFLKTDGGREWDQLDNVATSAISAVGNRLYTVRHTSDFQRDLFRSDDLGVTWSEISPPNWGPVGCVRANPINPDIVYSADDGIARSTDGGETWSEVWGRELVHSLTFDPEDPSVVYARTPGLVLRADFDDPVTAMPPPTEDDDGGLFDDAVSGLRLVGRWQLHRRANLGPRAGNGKDGFSIALDDRGETVFLGNRFNVSAAALGIEVVTATLADSDWHGETQGPLSVAMHPHAQRDELYVTDKGGRLIRVDLSTLTAVDTGNLGYIERGAVSFNSVRNEGFEVERSAAETIIDPERRVGGRPMAFDVLRDVLYVGNGALVSVVPLTAGERENLELESANPRCFPCGATVDMAVDAQQPGIGLASGSIPAILWRYT